MSGHACHLLHGRRVVAMPTVDGRTLWREMFVAVGFATLLADLSVDGATSRTTAPCL